MGSMSCEATAPGGRPGQPSGPPRARAFLGVEFDRLTLPEAVAAVAAGTGCEVFRYVVTPNVDHVLRISAQPEVAGLYRGAWLCLNDSRVLQRLAALAGLPLPVAPGADLVIELLTGADLERDTPIMVVGGHPGLAADLSSRFGFRDVVQHRPPMGLLGDRAAFAQALEAVEEARAALVFLAVGSPQQEYLAAALRERGRARGVGLCIGAALEFLLDARRRAPGWMQRAGLEWAFRLATEPRRLARRYLGGAPKILRLYLSHHVGRARNRPGD